MVTVAVINHGIEFGRSGSGSMGVCLLTRDLLRRHDHAGLAGLRPPRISDGAATLNVAVGMDTAERNQ